MPLTRKMKMNPYQNSFACIKFNCELRTLVANTNPLCKGILTILWPCSKYAVLCDYWGLYHHSINEKCQYMNVHSTLDHSSNLDYFVIQFVYWKIQNERKFRNQSKTKRTRKSHWNVNTIIPAYLGIIWIHFVSLSINQKRSKAVFLQVYSGT